MTTRATKIKNYLCENFVIDDDVLAAIKKNSHINGLPEIEVPPNVGKLLYCLTKIHQPKKVLELGTLAGYSTIWLARALNEDGKIVSLELDLCHAEIARDNFKLAGFEKKIEVRVGYASDLMDEMIAKKEGPFDLIFIDADKGNYPLYLKKSLQLSRSGTLILSDNLIPKGDDIGKPENLEAEGIYQFNHLIATHSSLESILTTTIVGENGRLDALGLSIVK